LRTKLDLSVDFSLNFTLVISQFIQGNFQRKMSDCFFIIILFEDISIILLLFYPFWFKCGYSVNDQLDFILTVIKRYYNSNDR